MAMFHHLSRVSSVRSNCAVRSFRSRWTCARRPFSTRGRIHFRRLFLVQPNPSCSSAADHTFRQRPSLDTANSLVLIDLPGSPNLGFASAIRRNPAKVVPHGIVKKKGVESPEKAVVHMESEPMHTRKPYQKPAFRYERVFETMALACGKVNSTQSHCRNNRKTS